MNYKVRFVNYPLQYKNLKREIDTAITRVLTKGDLILREDVETFEKNLASFVGVKYAVGVNSCTDALIFSLMANGVGAGDEVITVSHTFFATVEAITHCGAKPILVDVEKDFLIDATAIEGVITKKTKAILPVHLNGRLSDMVKIMALAKKYKLAVIEDAAQALGAKIKMENGAWKMAGSFGSAGCFSFYPAKILGGAGDGGAVVTNNKTLADVVRLLRNHGQKTKTEIVRYGFTSRLHNIQAAILNAKFAHVPEWIKKRQQIARAYDKGLSSLSSIVLPPKPDARHIDVYQNYVLRVKKRDELFKYLAQQGTETLIKDSIPLHHQKALGLSDFRLPFSEKLAKEVISLPMYPELTNKEIDYVISCIKNFYQG